MKTLYKVGVMLSLGKGVCMCVRVCITDMWGLESVYTLTLRGPVFLTGQNTSPHDMNH